MENSRLKGMWARYLSTVNCYTNKYLLQELCVENWGIGTHNELVLQRWTCTIACYQHLFEIQIVKVQFSSAEKVEGSSHGATAIFPFI